MSRAPLKNMPTDVLDTIRELVDTDAHSSKERPPPLRLTDPTYIPRPICAEAAELSEPVEGENRFVDRIVTRLATPGTAEAGPLIRTGGGAGDPGAPNLGAPSLGAPSLDAPSLGVVSATPDVTGLPVHEEPLCTLLLTKDFQISPPEPARLPHPVDPLAQDDYAEDSDLDRLAMTQEQAQEMSEALRAAFSHTLSAALSEADVTGPVAADPADVVTEDGYLDPDALKELVRGIVQDELRGDLGAQISQRIRVLVKAEVHRMLAVRSLD